MAGDVILLGNTLLAHPAGRERQGAGGGRGRGGAHHPVLARRGPRAHPRAVGRGRRRCARRWPTGSRDRTSAAHWLDGRVRPRPARRRARPRLHRGGDRGARAPCPPATTVVAERFFDEAGGMQLVIHAPFGGRINRAWGMALRKRFCRSFDFELQAAATDDGVLLSLGPQHSFPLECDLRDAAPERAARSCSTRPRSRRPCSPRAGAGTPPARSPSLRWQGGRRVPPYLQRMRAEDLLAAVFPAQLGCQDNAASGPIEIPDHPLVQRDAARLPHRGDGRRGPRAQRSGALHAGEIRARGARDAGAVRASPTRS